MNKRFFKCVSMVVCITLLIIGMATGTKANAAETQVFSVTDQQGFISALKNANEGDIVSIHGEITIGTHIPSPKGQIIIKRTSANDRLITYPGMEVNFQNMVFDGGGIKSDYPILTIQSDSYIENCTFQNCGNPESKGGSSCIGGAVRVEAGEVTFDNCYFFDNIAAAGGHLYIQGDSIVNLNQCTMTGGFAVNNGGAIGTYGTTACYVDSCLITENEAANYGGGIGNRSYVQVSNTKLYNNKSSYGGADIGNAAGATADLTDSLEQLVELFKDDGIIPKGWVCDYDFEEALYIPDIDPTIENSLLKLDFEYQQPETPDETEPPIEPEGSEPSTDDEQTDDPANDNPEETPPSDDETNEPDQQPEGSSPSNSTVDNSITNNSSSSSTNNSTDNSDRRTTDNSRQTTTKDSNNTSTVNNYYTQETAASSGAGSEVQTIVIPVDRAGNGEPINQTITIEGNTPEAAGSLEGMTLNINVNVGETEQATSTIPASGVSWYQVIVILLLFGILICLIKQR